MLYRLFRLAAVGGIAAAAAAATSHRSVSVCVWVDLMAGAVTVSQHHFLSALLGRLS